MALVSSQSFALRNLPTGSCKLRLTASDLGNFMTHPLLAPISSTAVQGCPFVWDRDTIVMGADKAGAGYVDFEGCWAVDAGLYKVRMIPVPPSTPGAPSSLRVSSKRVCEGPTSALLVASGLAEMFSGMKLNLDGIELTKPSLEVILPGKHSGVSEPMLEIQMRMRIRAVPPLNMQF
ncbi:hypothetical protein FOA52_008905 [Chlamydomonas sp. UWO 241]|nr:hypothetical protein FOA52_008905 [Chlamydomonas sp. UWO 241]